MCCLYYKFYSMEHHPSSSKPHLPFITETQVSEVTESNLYSLTSSLLSYYYFPANLDAMSMYASKSLAVLPMTLVICKFLRCGYYITVNVILNIADA